MTAALKMRQRSPAVELVRGACSLCNARGVCVGVRDRDALTCFTCTLSMAQLAAAELRANQRPHPKSCHCEACVVFDEGQRGEVANLVLVDADDEDEQPKSDPPVSSSGASDEDGTRARKRRVLSRWQVLEVD